MLGFKIEPKTIKNKKNKRIEQSKIKERKNYDKIKRKKNDEKTTNKQTIKCYGRKTSTK